MKTSKNELLVNVARMYYENNLSQQEIASQLNLSRPYISRLLTEAKDTGIVQFRVIDPFETDTELEKKIRTLTGLEKVIIAPSKDNISRLASVAKKAAYYLESIISNGDIISFSWGKTIYSVAKHLESPPSISDITAVQLCGGISNLNHNIYSSEIAQKFQQVLSAKPYVLNCPVIADDIRVRDAFLSDHLIKQVLDLGYRSNIAIFTMGTFGLQSALYRAGYLDAPEIYRLSELGAVGDICAHIINSDGEICDSSLDQRTISVPLKVLKEKPYRIGVAEGQSKVDCICAALKSNLINVLITDEETAHWILERLEN